MAEMSAYQPGRTSDEEDASQQKVMRYRAKQRRVARRSQSPLSPRHAINIDVYQPYKLD